MGNKKTEKKKRAKQRKKQEKIRIALEDIERSCDNKLRYEKLSQAHSWLDYFNRTLGYNGQHVYKCRWCGGFHLGRRRK